MATWLGDGLGAEPARVSFLSPGGLQARSGAVQMPSGGERLWKTPD